MLEASFRYGKGGVGEPQAYSFQKFLTIIYSPRMDQKDEKEDFGLSRPTSNRKEEDLHR